MPTTSSIEWTDMTWNPVTGCTKVSPGCMNCYAERMARRLKGMGLHRYRNGFGVTLHEDLIEAPLTWASPRLIFVNSMSDLFHEVVPDDFIRRVFTVMNRCPQHRFQILTKRSSRLHWAAHAVKWTPNIWMGVSVEDSRMAFRIHDLQRVPAAVRFLSCEPLISAIPQLPLDGIHWVIVGGESGPGARPMKAAWARNIRAQCRKAKVPFFFKQWGGFNKKAAGRVLDGQVYDAMPTPLPLSA